MALRIIRAADPIKVERLNMVIYGPPGVGKSSLAFTTESPLMLDFDNGAHRAVNRKDSVRIKTWEEVAAMNADDLSGYKTLVVDTAGRGLDTLTADIIRRNPKAGRGGSLTLQGYGTLKSEFAAWLKLVNGFGLDVVLIAHMDEQRNGDDIIERLDVQGGSKGEIYKAADAMGRIAIRDGKRMLLFSPTDAAFGKNPGQLEPLKIPEPTDPAFFNFLASVVGRIKDRLNTLTEEQAKAQEELEGWRSVINELQEPEHFTEKYEAVRKAPKAVQALFAARVTEKGYVFDKLTKSYKAPVESQA
jgi:hypothetical protein